MKKYGLIKYTTKSTIIELSALDVVSAPGLIKSSDNILDLLELGDLVGIMAPNADTMSQGMIEAHADVFDKAVIEQSILQGLNIVAIYKPDCNKNFIRVAEKYNNDWRLL